MIYVYLDNIRTINTRIWFSKLFVLHFWAYGVPQLARVTCFVHPYSKVVLPPLHFKLGLMKRHVISFRSRVGNFSSRRDICGKMKSSAGRIIGWIVFNILNNCYYYGCTNWKSKKQHKSKRSARLQMLIFHWKYQCRAKKKVLGLIHSRCLLIIL